jgi:hypothetical protein
MATTFNDDRVSLEPAPVKSGDTVHVNYTGLLRNSGAEHVYLHYGQDGWQDTSTVQMQRNQDGIFGAEIKANAHKEINFCFKDCANNWDNNNGWNWKADIQ